MAHYLVIKNVDAYIKYSAAVEADSAEAAIEKARANEGDYKWHREHEAIFDDREFFLEEVEELTAEEAALENAREDEPSGLANALLQPMETAPKDGTEFLGFNAKGRACIYKYEPQKFHTKPRPYFRSRTGGGLGVTWDRDNQPILWTPLPVVSIREAGYENFK